MDGAAIIVVEDDAATREHLIILLETSLYRMQSPQGGSAAWQQLKPLPIQTILLDRRLPDIDELPLCQDLYDALGPDVPIIMMMTTNAEAGLLAATHAAAAIRVLCTCFMSQTVLDALRAALPT